MTDHEGRKQQPLTLTTAARVARGRYPSDLLAGSPGLLIAPQAGAYSSPRYAPELHPLDSEWYFSGSTSCALASLVSGVRTCLLGTPTVAAHLPSGAFTLVDSSLHLAQRFPAMMRNDIMISRVEDAEFDARYHSVLLDPPWYFPELVQWLQIALQNVTVGGRVILPLLGEATRPSAIEDRAQVLSLLSEFGEIEVRRDAVEYDIPLFEERALFAAGIQLSGPWRRADLAIAEVFKVPQRDRLGRPANERKMAATSWSTFLIGNQVVKLRDGVAERPGCGFVDQVDGVPQFTLDSVSRRDPRLASVDIWTSRNRVGRVGNFNRIRGALTTLADARTVTLAAGELTHQGFNPDELTNLLELLELSDND